MTPNEKYSLLDLEFSSDEDEYQFQLNDSLQTEKYPNELDTNAEVPLLEVSSSGSLRSIALSTVEHESFQQYKPDKKWIWEFPLWMDNTLRNFDDYIISITQFTSNKAIGILCNIITFSVAIEIIFALPFVLFALGIDGLASEFTYLGLITAFLSQIPKRFIWRYRPWMIQRANKLRSTKTSSFPSRAVCCSVVLSFAICYTYWYFKELQIVWWWMPELFIIMFFLTSFARIFLGVHYPSDCIFGAIQGIFICLIGTLLWEVTLIGCSCDDECNSEYGSDEQLTSSNLRDMSLIPFFAVVLISFIVALLAILKPIHFWRKCDRSLGLLLPCVAFQIGFLCPGGSFANASLASPHDPAPWWAYPFALLIPIFAILFGQKMKSKYPLASFSILYVFVFSSLCIWRLFIFPLD